MNTLEERTFLSTHHFFPANLSPGLTSSPLFCLGPSTALSTVPAIPPLAASNCEPIAPSEEKGPPIFSPTCPIAPSAIEKKQNKNVSIGTR